MTSATFVCVVLVKLFVLRAEQPKLDEVGPFGYVKRTTKYDAYFADDGSDTVTYRSWTVFDAVSCLRRSPASLVETPYSHAIGTVLHCAILMR